MARAKSANLKIVEPSENTNRVTANQVRRWIEACEPRAELDVLVTPGIAAVLLEYNLPGVSNRVVSKRSLDEVIRVLETDQWINTGEPVVVSDQRTLNDGQHRLEGVVRSGIPARMDLRFGVPREAFSATNSGRHRSAGDALSMLKEDKPSNANTVASTLRMILAYEQGLPGALELRLSNREVVALLDRWPETSAAVAMTMGLGRGFKNSAMCALTFFALRVANSAAVEEFLHVLRTGEGAADNPPHRLREYVLHTPTTADREKRCHALALGIIAWNAWNGGHRSMRLLRHRKDVPFPTVIGLKL